MSELPAPLVPRETDLRQLRYMPLLVAVIDSDFNVQASDAEFRAAIALWCKAWHQVPAGSLPNNEASLAHLAGYGRDLAGWSKVRDGALSGFVLCADNRLYHPVLAEVAIESYRKVLAAASRGHRGAVKRWGGKNSSTGPSTPNPQPAPQPRPPKRPQEGAEAPPIEQPIEQASPEQSREQWTNGSNRSEVIYQSPDGDIDSAAPPPVDISENHSQNRGQQTQPRDTPAVRKTRARLRKQREDATRADPMPEHVRAMLPKILTEKPWWTSPAGVARRGRELDIARGPESFEAYRFKVMVNASTGNPPWPWLDVLTKAEQDALVKIVSGEAAKAGK